MCIVLDIYSSKKAAKDQFINFVPRNFSNISWAKNNNCSEQKYAETTKQITALAPMTLFLMKGQSSH